MTTSISPPASGVVAEIHDGEFRLALQPRPELLRHGALRASIIAFLVDVAAGVVLDDDPDAWTLTSDMSVRMRPLPAPAFVSTRTTILRRGRRSATAMVDVVTDEGEPVATGAIGFARVQRRETDPVKPPASPGACPTMFDGSRTLDRPLREEAGIVVLDPVAGALEMPVTPELRNPAGTLQGAMVALFAEAAAEELVSARFDIARGRDRARSALPGPDRRGPRRLGVHAARGRSRRARAGGALGPFERSTDDARLRPHGHHSRLSRPPGRRSVRAEPPQSPTGWSIGTARTWKPPGRGGGAHGRGASGSCCLALLRLGRRLIADELDVRRGRSWRSVTGRSMRPDARVAASPCDDGVDRLVTSAHRPAPWRRA